MWIKDILDEIINKDCRTDKNVILKAPCPNYQAYLLHLAINFKRSGSKKFPHVKDEQVMSWREKQEIDRARKDALVNFGNITVKIYIPIDDILNPGIGSSPLDMGSGGDELDDLRRKIIRYMSEHLPHLYGGSSMDPDLSKLVQKGIQLQAKYVKLIAELTTS
jgi:hypothetical protein